MHAPSRLLAATLAAAFALALSTGTRTPVSADEPGITPTEIVLGGLHPYSGPASSYGAIGKGAQAYFAYINDNGGVNGRKITYKDLDDAYSPPQAVQLAKQLVEQDHVFAMFNTLGTPSNTAIRQYLNQNQVPQLFVATGASTWGADAAKFPWTIGWQPDYQSESIIYARYLMKEDPSAKIAVLYQNDDYGEDYLTGLKDGLGKKADAIVKTASYEVTDPSVSSQIASLKASGATTFFIFATPKFSIQALVAAAQQSWKPRIFLNTVSNSQTTMKAATSAGGVAATQGVISVQYLKDPAEPKWDNDAGMKLYRAIAAKYMPGADQNNGYFLYGMGAAYTMVDCLQRAGKNLTRQRVMDAAIHLNERDNPFVISGVVVQTSPNNRFPIGQEQLASYNGTRFSLFGSLIGARGR
jgi:branched-chain amino acid transport system substrate-binding protein